MHTVDNKAKLAKFATEDGVTKAIRHFKETKGFTEPTV